MGTEAKAPPLLLTASEVAELLRCSHDTVRRLESEGLPFVPLRPGGRLHRYPRAAVLAWVEGRTERRETVAVPVPALKRKGRPPKGEPGDGAAWREFEGIGREGT